MEKETESRTEGKPESHPKGPCEIIVIGGFLGSGKTTLLKRFLDWEFRLGTRPQVIMSEFGDIDVDATVISDERLDVTAVVGGCVCCGSRDELANALTKILQTTPGSRIYIETTGVADPAGVLEAIAPTIRDDTATIRKVIVVYDASSHNDLEKDAVLIERQLMTTDWIILNKCDLVPEKIDSIAGDLSRTNPAAPVSRTVACAIDPETAMKGISGVTVAGETEHTEGAYSSFAFPLKDQLSQRALEEWLAWLPSSVLRVKGLVRLQGQTGFFEVQATRGQCSITPFPTRRWHNSAIVVIAHPMQGDELARRLQDCVAK